MKMKKTATWSVLVLALILVVVAIGVYLNLSDIARQTTQRVASNAIGVPVVIERMEIDIQNQKVTAGGIKVSNPVGFDKNEYALTLEDVTVQAKSLSRDKLHFALVETSGLNVFLEARPEGTNLGKLRQNLGRGQESSATQDAQTGTQKPKIVIDRLAFKDNNLHPTLSYGQTKQLDTLSISDFAMTDLGKDGAEGKPGQVVSRIVGMVTRKALEKAAEEQMLSGLKDKALEQLDANINLDQGVMDNLKSDMKDMGGKIENMLGN